MSLCKFNQNAGENLKIIAQVFQKGCCYLQIKNKKTKKVSLYPTSFLMSNKKICYQFSQEDCLLIGYAEAQNQEWRIRRELALLHA